MTGDTTKIFNAIDTVEEPEVKALRERLIERVRNAVKGSAPVDQIPGLHLSYVEQAQTVSNCFYVLSVGLILQGTKNLVIGDKSYRYGTGSMIVTSVDMPTSYELVGVKPSNPFVSLSLRLNPATIADFLLEEAPPQDGVRDVFNVEKPTQELLEDFERLLKLLDHPEQIKARAPILICDIHYLALSSSSGACLRALYAPLASASESPFNGCEPTSGNPFLLSRWLPLPAWRRQRFTGTSKASHLCRRSNIRSGCVCTKRSSSCSREKGM